MNNLPSPADIKSSVALEALTGIRSIEELALLHNVSVGVIIEWKNDYMILCRKNLQTSVETIIGEHS